MPKTITLRLKDDVYALLAQAAKAENRTIANLIETSAVAKIRESQFVDDVELAEIVENRDLLNRIAAGRQDARESKGRFVE